MSKRVAKQDTKTAAKDAKDAAKADLDAELAKEVKAEEGIMPVD
jgi:hypothetical protein